MEAVTLLVSIAALVISLGAAGFSGWQAVTAHLERTRPKPAALSLVRNDPYWEVENSGGSLATGIRLTFTYELAKRRGEKAVATVRGDVPAGQRRRVSDLNERGAHFIVAGRHARNADGRMSRVGDGEPGVRILAERVRVDWVDYQGKHKSSMIRLP